MKKAFVLVGLMALLQNCGTNDKFRQEITFESGPFTLAGELRLPPTEGPHPVIIFVHGDGPNNRTSGVTYPPIMEQMLRAGYATFAWDKPGSGESTGRIDRSRLLEQRSEIVLAGIDTIKRHPDIDLNMIGLWGISQAGYVMPLVLQKSQDITFMIAISCPGGTGFSQMTYLLSSQMICAGYPEDLRAEAESKIRSIAAAQSYEEYARLKTLLATEKSFRTLSEIGFKVEVIPQTEWHREDFSSEHFSYNPIHIIRETKIPVLAVFGENDTQVDPFQGVEAYTRALEYAGNPRSRVVLIPGTDHNILISETGCIRERNRRSSAGWRNYPDEYLHVLENWLKSIKVDRNTMTNEPPDLKIQLPVLFQEPLLFLN